MTVSLQNRNAPAIAAYQSQDIIASKEFHIDRIITDEPHKTNELRKEKYYESLLRSSEKGLLHTAIIFSSFLTLRVLNSELQLQDTTLVKLITIFTILYSGAHAIILAILDYQKVTEYRNFYNNEKRREAWECDNYIEGEQREMIQLYELKGLSKEEAEIVVSIFSKNTNMFVDLMMKEELELMPPDKRNAFVNSFVIFLSNSVFGLLPLLAIVLYYHYSLSFEAMAVCAFLITEAGLICNGTLKSAFTVSGRLVTCIQMAVNGLLCFLGPVVVLRLLVNIL